MILIPLAVVWSGYLLGWYGFAMLKGPGMGIMDLIKPSQISYADNVLKNGVQPGTIIVPGDGAPATPTGPSSPPPGWKYLPPGTPGSQGGAGIMQGP